MLKVLHVITGLNQGGAETALLRLMTSEDTSRFNSEVFSLIGDGAVARQMRERGLHPLNCGPRKPGIGASLLSLVSHCRRTRPDILQGWMYHGNLAATLAASAARIPVHGWNMRCCPSERLEEKVGTRAAVTIGAKLSRLPAWIIYNSHRGAAQHLERGYAPARARVIPNGFDCEMLRPDADLRATLRNNLGLPETALVVGTLGRYHAQKDYPAFVRAAEKIARRFANACFVAIGTDVDWKNQALRHQIEGLGLKSRFHLLGEVAQGGRYAAMFDVNVLASAFGEAFPNVVAEGMACGVPCVATDVGDTGWIIGATGRVVPASDWNALADGVCDILSRTPDERQRLGALARARVLNEFSMSKNVAAYAETFESARGRGAAMRPLDCPATKSGP